MHRRESLHRFDLDDDLSLYEQIDTKRGRKRFALIHDIDRDLSRDRKAAARQCGGKQLLIDGFEQPRPHPYVKLTAESTIAPVTSSVSTLGLPPLRASA